MPIFDQGYQHWKGALSGHAWRWLVITKQGLRGQLKGTLSLARILLLAALLPALALVVAMALWGLVEQKSETILESAAARSSRQALPPIPTPTGTRSGRSPIRSSSRSNSS